MRVGRGPLVYWQRSGVSDAAVVNAGERADEGIFDDREIAEREVALAELAVHQALHDHGVNGGFDSAGSGLIDGAHDRLAPIADHDDGNFTRLRLGAGVAELALGDFGHVVALALLFFLRGVEEVFDQGGAMVLADELMDDEGEGVFAGQFDAVLDVADDDQQAHGGREFVVAVGAAGFLVFDEVLWFGELADVVVVSADAAEEAVGTDGGGGGFGHDADGEGVVEGAGGFLLKAAEERLVGVAEFEQGHGGGDLEDAFDGGEDGECEHGDADAGEGGGEALHADGAGVGGDEPGGPDIADHARETEGPDHGEGGDGGDEADLNETATSADFLEGEAEDGGTAEHRKVEVDVLAEGDGDQKAVNGGDAEGEALVVGDDENDGGEECGRDGGGIDGPPGNVDHGQPGGEEGGEEEYADGPAATDRAGDAAHAHDIERAGDRENENDHGAAEGGEPGGEAVDRGLGGVELILGGFERLDLFGGDGFAARHDDLIFLDGAAEGFHRGGTLVGELGGEFGIIVVGGGVEAGEVGDDGVAEPFGEIVANVLFDLFELGGVGGRRWR